MHLMRGILYFKTRNFSLKTEELCIKTDELCSSNGAYAGHNGPDPASPLTAEEVRANAPKPSTIYSTKSTVYSTKFIQMW